MISVSRPGRRCQTMGKRAGTTCLQNTTMISGAGRTEHYRYNSRNQLTELDSTAGTVRYEYDPAGSLTAEVHTAQGGGAAERTGYTYDAYNRNTSVCGAGYVQQNHYDAEGLRYAVTENGETTNFVYRNGMPVSELDADKNPVRGYVLENEYISQVNGTTFGYYLNDGQESVRYLTGSDGSIRNHYRYSAFGETITAEETVSNRLRYNGQMADGLTGLYYLRARYYNASLGRFTQEDVIYNDGLNLYAYCSSNPVMYEDPSGYSAWDDFRKQNKGKYNKKELSQAYEKSGLKSSKNAIYDPKSGKKFKYSDSSIRPSYGANQVQTVWDRDVVKDPSSSHYGQVYDEKNNKWLSWNKSEPRQGQWDMGHIENKEYRGALEKYINMEYDPNDFDRNQQLFESYYRNPDNYHAEDCHGNRSDNQKNKNKCQKKG